jgi:hypothetical protein
LNHALDLHFVLIYPVWVPWHRSSQKGEESSGSNFSALIPSSDLLLMMPWGVSKIGGECRDLNLSVVSFRTSQKVCEGGSHIEGASVSEVIQLTGV